MVYVTRVEHFNAAHQLWNDSWSEEKNREVFGKCANKNYHGHNYELHVTVKGVPHEDTGFVVNAKDLGKVIKETVVEKVDHKNLNVDVDFMTGQKTSVENLARGIWNILFSHVRTLGAELHEIKLIETPKIYVKYYGG